MESARKIWEDLGLPPLKPQAPWFGISLGEWEESFDLMAKRAVESDYWVTNHFHVQATRAKALRDAFDATMKDPDFLAEAGKFDLEVRPVSGARLDEIVREIYSYPPDVVKIAADAIRNVR